MSKRRRSVVLAALGALVLACGRGGSPPATPVPAPVTPAAPALDTTAAVDTAAADTSRAIALPPPPPAATDSARRAGTSERPGQRCILNLTNTPDTRVLIITDPLSGKRTTYLGGGVVGVCARQNIRIVADSAESYEQNRLYFLIGDVKYREDRVSLDADRLTYFQGDERLLAEGNVVAVMEDSSSMTGPRAEYFRAVTGIRTSPRIVATGRPTLRMYETDSTGRRQTQPVTLIANTIVGEGETLFVAHGRVELDRVDLKARGDSAMLDNNRQFSRLMKQPVVESKGSQPFTLTGRVIDVFGNSRRLDRVMSRDSASAKSSDLTLTADTVDLRIRNDQLERAYAFGAGPGLARAVTSERTMVADSLYVSMPEQRIHELHAVGQAYAESDPDSTKIVTGQRDWLKGDTIVALFDTAAASKRAARDRLPRRDSTAVRDSIAARDSADRPVIQELIARGSASSFYQIPNNKGEKAQPGLNYVRGEVIRVDFREGEVETVTVKKQAAGMYLEPTPIDTSSTRRDARSTRPPARRPSQP